MAQLAVAGAGAAVGFVLGGPVGAQIGWALGGVAGALLFPPKGQDSQGPRLSDLTVQTSGYGLPIPMAVGRVKLAGNVIWKTDIRERATTRRQGKGGGGAKSTTYTYFLSWAVGLCEWLIPPSDPQVLRIWLDTHLVYDTTGASEVTQIPGLVWRFHPGSETQLPDPLLAASLGADGAPAHRGLAYLVFEEVPLERFGNRMPNVTVELAGDAMRSFPQVATIPPATPLWPSSPSGRTYIGNWACNVAIDYRRGRIYEGRVRTSTTGGGANEMIRVYDLVTMQTLAEHTLDRIFAPLFSFGAGPGPDSTGTGLMHLGVDGFLYVTGGGVNRVPLWKIDPEPLRQCRDQPASRAGVAIPALPGRGAEHARRGVPAVGDGGGRGGADHHRDLHHQGHLHGGFLLQRADRPHADRSGGDAGSQPRAGLDAGHLPGQGVRPGALADGRGLGRAAVRAGVRWRGERPRGHRGRRAGLHHHHAVERAGEGLERRRADG